MGRESAELLRKIASFLREQDAAEREQTTKQAAHVLRAAKGIAILQERT